MIILWIVLGIIAWFVVGAAAAGVAAYYIDKGEKNKEKTKGKDYNKEDEAVSTVILLGLIVIFWPFVGAFGLAFCVVQSFSRSKDEKKSEATVEVK